MIKDKQKREIRAEEVKMCNKLAGGKLKVMSGNDIFSLEITWSDEWRTEGTCPDESEMEKLDANEGQLCD